MCVCVCVCVCVYMCVVFSRGVLEVCWSNSAHLAVSRSVCCRTEEGRGMGQDRGGKGMGQDRGRGWVRTGESGQRVGESGQRGDKLGQNV